VDTLRLLFSNNPLEDAKTLNDYKIENDNIVFLVYKKEGMSHFTFPFIYFAEISIEKRVRNE
jgi:hypothetical protein